MWFLVFVNNSGMKKFFNILINILPLPLVCLYFVGAFVLAFPDTAYMDLIDNTLSMSQSSQSVFYATIMIPWYFKPFYGWIVSCTKDNIRGCVFVASLFSAIAYFLTSVAVQTEGQLYAATLLRSASNAFSELCLGVALIEVSQVSKVAIGSLQSVATGSRAAGSLVAYLVSLPLYPCEKPAVLSSGSIIGMNAAFCLLGMILAMYIPNLQYGKLNSSIPLSVSKNLAILVLSVITGFGVFWITETQQKSALYVRTPSEIWYASASVALLIFILLSMWLLRRPSVSAAPSSVTEDEDSEEKEEEEEEKKRIPLSSLSAIYPALFLFAYNVTPSSETQYSNFQYKIFSTTKICNYQYLSIITMSSSLLGSALYGYLYGKESTPRVLVLATLLSVLAGLLRLPLTYHANDFIDDGNDSCLQVTFFRCLSHFVSGNCVDVAFFYLSISSVIEGVLSQFVAVSLVVLAVERCPISRSSGIWYGVFLSCLELGNSVGGWITAPIVSALQIQYNDFSNLSDLIWIESASKVAILILVPVLLSVGDTGETVRKNCDDDDDDDKDEESRQASIHVIRELEAPLLSSHHDTDSG